jgi:hypothetical protein
MGSSVTRQGAHWQPACTNLEPANKDIVREKFSLNLTTTVVSCGVCSQIFRGGTQGRVVDPVSNAVGARRAREEQRGAPRVKVNCTYCDQSLRLRYKKWRPTSILGGRSTNKDITIPHRIAIIGERDCNTTAALIRLAYLRCKGMGFSGVFFVGLKSFLKFPKWTLRKGPNFSNRQQEYERNGMMDASFQILDINNPICVRGSGTL